MNDEINRKRFLRRLEFWLIVVACIVATVLIGLSGCTRANDPGARPASLEPSPVIRSFRVATSVAVTEFRDSAGRVCVLVIAGNVAASSLRPVALDCARALPPLDYERLPEPEISPIPRRH